IDNIPPTVAISIDNAALTVNGTATVTFDFSEDVGSSFALDDVSIIGGGTLTNLVKVSATQYTATYKAPTTASNVSLSIINDKFTDIAGNPNQDGADANNTVSLTVSYVEASISSVTLANINETGLVQTAFTVNLTAVGQTSSTSFGIEVTSTAKPSIDYGSAVFSNGVTYDSGTDKLIIPANVSSFTVGFAPVVDKVTEGAETIVAKIGSGTYTSTINDTSLSEVAITVISPELKYEGIASQRENSSDIGSVLTYTVTLTNVNPDKPTVVTVKLSGQATTPGKTGADYVAKLADGTVINSDTVTLTIPAGQKTASFTVDPILEANADAFGAEGQENVIATIQAATSYSIVTATATGLIIDGNPLAMGTLTGDMSLKVGPAQGDLTNGASNAAQLTQVQGGILATNYDDQLNIGYKQNGLAGGYGDISNYLDENAGGFITDNSTARTTIDLAKGNDILRIAGNQLGLTSVYLGEGSDQYHIAGNMSSAGGSSFIFGEAGDDTVTIGGLVGGLYGSNIYLGSGSDNLTVGNDFAGLLDLGSGGVMPTDYYATYHNDGLSLGNDSNMDLATDINIVNILGNIQSSSEIYGGVGKDTITTKGVNNASTITLGAGNDQLTVTNELGIGTGSPVIDLGAGDDTFTWGGIWSSVDSSTKIQGGTGADTLILNSTTAPTNTDIMHISSQVFTGFEKIVLQNNATVDIRYSDLLADTTNTGPLYITGTSSNKVDLGGGSYYGDWNTDTDLNLRDGNLGATTYWKKTGTYTDTVTNTTYDIYHHDSAGVTNLTNDVYIQQGIIVI
ncbi:TPA: hypothetical protein MW168_003747, partial [Acinetobacter baumannii]|nr:hypothetical protein [Acinetobacter baumannii]